ncbi:hypothetical protein L9F63_011112, partial [Diploptera punctata]
PVISKMLVVLNKDIRFRTRTTIQGVSSYAKLESKMQKTQENFLMHTYIRKNLQYNICIYIYIQISVQHNFHQSQNMFPNDAPSHRPENMHQHILCNHFTRLAYAKKAQECEVWQT